MTLAKALSNIIVLGPTKRRNINNQEIEHNKYYNTHLLLNIGLLISSITSLRKVLKIKIILNLNLTNLLHVVIIVVMSSLKLVSNQAKVFQFCI